MLNTVISQNTVRSRANNRSIDRKCVKERACNILLARLIRQAHDNVDNIESQFVSRRELETIIANSRYSETVNKTIGYVNDAITYHDAVLDYRYHASNQRYITAVRVVNAFQFNANGTRKSIEQMKQELAALAQSFSQNETESQETSEVSEVSVPETLLLTDESSDIFDTIVSEDAFLDSIIAETQKVSNDETLLITDESSVKTVTRTPRKRTRKAA